MSGGTKKFERARERRFYAQRMASERMLFRESILRRAAGSFNSRELSGDSVGALEKGEDVEWWPVKTQCDVREL